jgi:hypothetical protein
MNTKKKFHTQVDIFFIADFYSVHLFTTQLIFFFSFDFINVLLFEKQRPLIILFNFNGKINGAKL